VPLGRHLSPDAFARRVRAALDVARHVEPGERRA
jgi:hypothetical protein